MKDLIFESWHSWWVCFTSGWKKFGWGAMRIITCIILGFVSIFVWLWKTACSFVRQNPKLAICTFLVIAVLVWLLTFVSMKGRVVGVEHQRDVIAWQYHDFKTSHGYFD